MSSDPNGIGRLNEFPIITVCGSMRYFPLMLLAAAEYTSQGWIVQMPFTVEEEGSAVKEMLDLQHLAKISMSKAILVVGNHIDGSTTREIEYANSLNLTVIPYQHNERKPVTSPLISETGLCVCGCKRYAGEAVCNHCYFGQQSPDNSHGPTVSGVLRKPGGKLPVNSHCTNCRQPIQDGDGWQREQTREQYRIHFKCPVSLTAHGRESND